MAGNDSDQNPHRPRPLPVAKPLAPAETPPVANFQPQFAPSEPQHKDNTLKILAIVCGVIVCTVLLFCGGIGAFAYVGFLRAKAQVAKATAEAKRNFVVLEQQERDAQRLRNEAQQVLRQNLEETRRAQGRRRDESPAQSEASIPGGAPAPFPLPPTREQIEAALPPLERHLAWLKGYDSEKVSQALTWFASQPLDEVKRYEVQPALLQKLHDRDHREAAIQALGVWGDERTVNEVARLAKFDKEMVSPVVEFLAKRPSDEATTALIELLRRGEAQAAAAKEALAERPGAKDKLITLVNDRDQALRNHVRDVLKEMKVSDDELFAQVQLDLADMQHGRALPAIEWLGVAELSKENRAKALEALTAALSNQDFQVRGAAIKALINDKSDEASTALVATLDDERGPWAMALAELVNRNDDRVVDKITDFVRQPIRMGQTLHAIRETKSGEEVIIKTLETTKDREVQRHILFAMAPIATDKSLPALKKLEKTAQQTKDIGLQVAVRHVLTQLEQRGAK